MAHTEREGSFVIRLFLVVMLKHAIVIFEEFRLAHGDIIVIWETDYLVLVANLYAAK